MIYCLHCGAETSNGLALCDLCRRKLTTDLDYLPAYFRNLARWRPGRAGSRPVPGSRVLYDDSPAKVGTGDRISDTLDEALTTLTTWARALSDARGPFVQPHTLADAVIAGELSEETAEALNDDQAELVKLLCDGLNHHLTSIATLDWCGEMVRDLGWHEERLRGLTETSVPGWYAGACRRCGVPTYVVPGLSWVTCSGCGAHTYARDHLETILDEARSWVGRPKRLAEAIVALVDSEQSVPKLYTRIRQWAHQGDLMPIHRTKRDHVWSYEHSRLVVADVEAGHARYRFGDVLDLSCHATPRASTSRAS